MVGIVLILSAVALPGLVGMVTDTSIYEVGVRLQQDIRLVQQLSITRRSSYPALRIDFDPAGRFYSVVTPEKTLVRTFPSSITVSLSGLVSPLSFDAFGEPRQSATPADLSTDGTFVFSNSGGTKRVSVVVGMVVGRTSIKWTAR